ncbi:MAG: nucleotidyltransferase domain-containing protein [Chloroflexota bacterium]
MEKLDLETILSQLKEYFAQQPEIVLAYLYGSYATGKPHAQSDMDIGVLFDDSLSSSEQFHRALYYSDKVSHLLGLGAKGIDVDVRELNGLPIEFLYQVISPRKCIHARSERERIQFEVDTINDYLDFKPVLDHYYNYMLRQLAEGNVLYGYDVRNRVAALGQAPRAARGTGTASAGKLA